MADDTETPSELPSGRGQFGMRVAALDKRVTAIEEQFERVKAIAEAFEPEELDWIWENFRGLTEVVSALRRLNGLAPLSEFDGTRARRRRAEAREAARLAATAASAAG